MKRKIAISFAGLLLILTASFAPIAQSTVPGCDLFVTMGGKVDGMMFMYVNVIGPNTRGGLALPLKAPFATRAPLLKPMHLLENICFDFPVDVDGDGIFDIIPIMKEMLVPIVHYAWVEFRGTFWRFMLVAPAPGTGVIFINPMMPGDVDCYTENYDEGVFWAPPSPLAGTFAAASGGHYKWLTGDFSPPLAARFPSPGADGIPGTALWGDPADGFGDGIPDPPGSSILMLPLIFMGDEWNGTDWVPTIATPMPLVLTTGVAYDHVAEPESKIYCFESTEVGMPWEFMSVLPWDPDLWLHPKAFVKVIYVCAWSNLMYCLNPDEDGDCVPEPEEITGYYYNIDFFWEYAEKKVREDVVIADVNCDQKVDICDLVVAGKSFGSRDEGFDTDGDGLPDLKVADPDYDPRGDLDCDGRITIVDVVGIARDFGKEIDP